VYCAACCVIRKRSSFRSEVTQSGKTGVSRFSNEVLEPAMSRLGYLCDATSAFALTTEVKADLPNQR
jgi:hypothetical protein